MTFKVETHLCSSVLDPTTFKVKCLQGRTTGEGNRQRPYSVVANRIVVETEGSKQVISCHGNEELGPADRSDVRIGA